MAITYDFIVYSRRISATDWILGMKAVHGEVPLDIVVPDEYGSSASDNSEVVGVLTSRRFGTREHRWYGTLPIPPAVESKEK